MTISATVSATMRTTFREQGYLVVPGVLTEEQLATGRNLVAAELEKEPPQPGHVGLHYTWPRFEDGPHPLLDFYSETVRALPAGAQQRRQHRARSTGDDLLPVAGTRAQRSVA